MIYTVDRRNPAITTWDVKNLVNNGINYQPQLVSRISEPSTVSFSTTWDKENTTLVTTSLEAIWNYTANPVIGETSWSSHFGLQRIIFVAKFLYQLGK